MLVSNAFYKYSRLLMSLLVMQMLWSCTEAPLVVYKNDPSLEYKFLNKWLADAENFKNEVSYRQKFDAYFDEALKTQNYRQADDAMKAVCEVMSSRGYYDEYYYQKLKKYVKDHEADISKEQLFSFYVYLGVTETFNGDYKKSTETLSNLDKYEANNYSKFLDKGYAYYYISCNYFYLGDYSKSIDILNKAESNFKRTDDLRGPIVVQTWKANVQFASNNLDEALITMDKALALYDKANDPEGKARLMLSKHDYLQEKDPKKSAAYLEEIEKFISENDIQYIHVQLHYNHIKIKKYLAEKNLTQLNILVPLFEKQVKEVNIDNWNNLYVSIASRYELLKSQEITNRADLLRLLATYKANKDYLYLVDIYNILKEEAVANKNLADVLKFDQLIDKIEKDINRDELQLKVKVFEKKIDVAKKEKTILEQDAQITKNKSLLIGLLLLFIVIALFTALYFVRRKKQEAQAQTKLQEQFTFQLLQNTEEERSRIAGELHDSVNHDLLNIKNSLAQGKNIAVEEVASVIEEVRNISRNLHPAVFETIGLEASIENLCERISEIGLFTTCEIDYSKTLSKNKELQLYRIIQEALNNTLKHGKADAAKVILTSKDSILQLEIKDNGNGFDVDKQLKNPKSFGLQSIMQRAKAIAGKININSNNRGTQIFIQIPV